jgi:hypothetical protein
MWADGWDGQPIRRNRPQSSASQNAKRYETGGRGAGSANATRIFIFFIMILVVVLILLVVLFLVIAEIVVVVPLLAARHTQRSTRNDTQDRAMVTSFCVAVPAFAELGGASAAHCWGRPVAGCPPTHRAPTFRVRCGYPDQALSRGSEHVSPPRRRLPRPAPARASSRVPIFVAPSRGDRPNRTP